MADGSLIEWTDATWNPITGCSVISPGCANCYAMRLAGTRLQHHPSRAGLTVESKAGPVWNGKVRLNEDWLDQPIRWKKPRRIFVCAHGDLFHEAVPDLWIDQVFAVMALAPQHTFQVLTKRSARMRAYCEALMARQRSLCVAASDAGLGSRSAAIFQAFGDDIDGESVGRWRPLPNVWLGVSAEDQPRLNERGPDLEATPAAVRFLSAEPIVGAIDAGELLARGAVQWVIAGGESGPGARPMHPAWLRQLRDQCSAAGVAFFFKQWGAWTTYYDRDLQDPDWRRAADVLDGTAETRWLNLAGGHGFHGERVVAVRNVGKSAAGRELDGLTFSAFPVALS